MRRKDRLPAAAPVNLIGAGVCWADTDQVRVDGFSHTGESLKACTERAVTDLGLCEFHHREIVGGEP